MNEIKGNNRIVSLKDAGDSNKMHNETTTKHNDRHSTICCFLIFGIINKKSWAD